VKHKYIEAINRKLSWERQFPVHARHVGLKGFMCSAWCGQHPRPGGRWVNVDELKPMNEDSQRTKERGIEDVEQSPVDKLLESYGFSGRFQTRDNSQPDPEY